MTFPDWFTPRHPQISAASAAAVLKLADEGATVPFIARYRKEETGNLDEVAIRQVIDAKESWDEILKRQAFIVEEIERQGKLTPELKDQLLATFELTVLEDLYLPYKQKRKTKATVAKEAGLEPLAELALGRAATDCCRPRPERRPKRARWRSATPSKGVADVAAALAGASDILVERLSEDAGLRQTVRSAFFEQGHVRTRKADKAKPNSRFENYFAYQESGRRAARSRAARIATSRCGAAGWRRSWCCRSAARSPPPSPTTHPRREEGARGGRSAAGASGRAVRGGGVQRARTSRARRCSRAPRARRCAAYVVPAIENEVHKALARRRRPGGHRGLRGERREAPARGAVRPQGGARRRSRPAHRLQAGRRRRLGRVTSASSVDPPRVASAARRGAAPMLADLGREGRHPRRRRRQRHRRPRDGELRARGAARRPASATSRS